MTGDTKEGWTAALEWFERISTTDSQAAPVPPSGVLPVYQLKDPERPELLAEFAGFLMLRREGKRLVWSERGSLRWFYFGTLVRADDGSLVVGDLAVHPWSTADGAGFRGLTREVLAAISPTMIVEAVARTPVISGRRGREIALTPLAPGASRRGRPPSLPHQVLGEYALRYLELLDRGKGRGIHTRLAEEFGLRSAAQSRELARRARAQGFLIGTGKGRAGGRPGPRLTGYPQSKGER
jgi:hypothetical protein